MANGGNAGQFTGRPHTSRTPDRPKLRSTAPGRIVPVWRRLVFLTFAAIFFGLSLLGVLLPGIPATPFLLLTSYFLVRSSPRLNARLLRSPIFGPILLDWQVHGGVRMRVRCKAIAAVVIAVAVSVYITGKSLPATLTVVLLAMAGVIVILKLPAAKDPDAARGW